MSSNPLVGIVMGSDSDWPKIEKAAKALAEFDIPCEVRVMSAHRTPGIVTEYATTAVEIGEAMLAATRGVEHPHILGSADINALAAAGRSG